METIQLFRVCLHKKRIVVIVRAQLQTPEPLPVGDLAHPLLTAKMLLRLRKKIYSECIVNCLCRTLEYMIRIPKAVIDALNVVTASEPGTKEGKLRESMPLIEEVQDLLSIGNTLERSIFVHTNACIVFAFSRLVQTSGNMLKYMRTIVTDSHVLYLAAMKTAQGWICCSVICANSMESRTLIWGSGSLLSVQMMVYLMVNSRFKKYSCQ